jgi:exonuclease III
MQKISRYSVSATFLFIMLILLSCGTNTYFTNPDVTDSTGIAFGTDSTFDVVTWNIENYPKHDPETSDLLRTLLPAMQVEAIAVQEVSNISAFYSLVNSLQGWSYKISGSGDTQTAILYKNTSIEVDSTAVLFMGMSNPFPRPPLLVKLHWQGREIILISLHLKAYGDNNIDESDSYDEEVRRRYACQLMDQYISTYQHDRKVIIVGDYNDQIQESQSSNVFLSFINKPEEYEFADMSIAQNLNSQNCSYPKYTSHLDHILITNELFPAFANGGHYIRTIQAERYIAGGWTNYYKYISDHRPVAARFRFLP